MAVNRRLFKFMVWVQIPLILASLGFYAWVWFSLRPLLHQRQQLKAEIEEGTRGLNLTRAEYAAQRSKVAELQSIIERFGDPQLAELARRVSPPVVEQITPQASSRPLGYNGGPWNQPLYAYHVWVAGPTWALNQIARVKYEFPPRFQKPVQISDERDGTEPFMVKYSGWNCVVVGVTLELVDPKEKPQQIALDMCASLTAKGQKPSG